MAQQWTERLGLIWAGALFQGFYLMALYWAILHGLPVAIAALIAGLQPAFTAMFAATLLGEKLSTGQASGIAFGLCGVGLVLSPKLMMSGAGPTFGLALMSLAAPTPPYTRSGSSTWAIGPEPRFSSWEHFCRRPFLL